MTATESQDLAGRFRHFARHEFHGHSPRYEFLSYVLAERPDLAAPLLAAAPPQRRPILYFAAVQYLLRTIAPEHPLASYLPVLDGVRETDENLPVALGDFVSSYREELTRLCATRTTQTNEARRAAQLRPAFGRATTVFPDRSLGLVELGTSAGLLLISDRYACRYDDPHGRSEAYGPAGVPEVLTMTCSVRGGNWPEPAAVDPIVAERVGIDLAPIDVTDPAAAGWLRACVWPEHTDRLARLDAAIAEVARVRPRVVAGDMVGELPVVVAALADSTVPCVFASHAVTYLDDSGRRGLVETLHGLGAERDLVVVFNEAAQCGAELVLGRRPPQAGPPGVLAVGLLTLVIWRNGRATVEVLARTGPHGQWLEWVPQEYPAVFA